jgi:hypothetical protein
MKASKTIKGLHHRRIAGGTNPIPLKVFAVEIQSKDKETRQLVESWRANKRPLKPSKDAKPAPKPAPAPTFTKGRR